MVLQSSESIFSPLPGYFGSCSVAFRLSGGEIQPRSTELFRKILSCCTKHDDKAISFPRLGSRLENRCSIKSVMEDSACAQSP
jgi:hypothetical protein